MEWQVRNEISILLRSDAPSQSNYFPMFWGKAAVSTSRVKISKNYSLNTTHPKFVRHYSNSETLPTYVWQWLKKQMMVRRSCWYLCWAATLHHVVTPLHFVQSEQLRVWTQLLVSQQLAEESGRMQPFSPDCWDCLCSIFATCAHIQHIYQELCHLFKGEYLVRNTTNLEQMVYSMIWNYMFWPLLAIFSFLQFFKTSLYML